VPNNRIARRLEHAGIVWQAATGRYPRVSAEFVFSHWPVRDGVRWTPQRLAWTALLMAWDKGSTMQARFQHACQPGHDLHRHWQLGNSYGGFTAAVSPPRWPSPRLRWCRALSVASSNRCGPWRGHVGGYAAGAHSRPMARGLKPRIRRPTKRGWAVPGIMHHPLCKSTLARAAAILAGG